MPNLLIVLMATVPLAGAAQEPAGVKLAQAGDGSVDVRTPVYSARIDGRGNLESLSVRGSAALAQKFGTPGAPPPAAPTVRLAGKTVTVRSGKARTAYTFAEDRIKVSTEGYTFEARPDDSVRAVLAPQGKGGAYTRAAVYPGSSALVLANNRTVVYSAPFHVMWQRLVPSRYCDGSLQPGAPLEFDLLLGAAVAPREMLSQVGITPVGSGYGRLTEGGNQGYGLVHFPRPGEVVFETSQENLGGAAFEIEYRLSVLNHYVAGKEVVRQERRLKLAAGGKGEVRWHLPALEPGVYYLTVSAWAGGSQLTASRQTFAVDLTHYAPPLTRPADFREFWERQERKLRDTAPEPALKQVSAAANPNRAYELTLNMPGGGRLRGLLYVPGRPGPGPAVLGSLAGSALNDLLEKARAPAFKMDEETTTLVLALPEDATYTRWESAEDNNLVQCVLCYLRAADYLAGRPDVARGRIKAVGASRSGPLVFITAARRPGLICAVAAHVPTSAGSSWEDRPYTGWGGLSPREALDPKAARRRAQMAAYVDPINHAPEVRVPVILAYGVDDDLSPPQGIEALYHHTASAWKRISRDGGGHQLSAGFRQLQHDLDAHLKDGAPKKR